MAKHKVFKFDEVPSEKLAQVRRLARQGGKPAEAAALLGYPGTLQQFVRSARKQWSIEFQKNWNRAHEGHLAEEALA